LFIAFARYYNLHVKILVTKTDRMPATTYQEAWDYLKDSGFQVHFFSSALPNQAHLASMIREGKIIAFAGQTGVGKSTLINLLNPDYARTIGSYSEALGRGKHQTKEVILLPFGNSFIADTPGFSSLVLPMVKHEAAKVFPGFETAFVHCKFFNCTHQGEPGCHIQTLVNRGKIPLTFYQDYLKLIAKLPEREAFE
jgi:ribosome biogenesis GTPase / thiamine phosphate phosphatase